MTSRERAWVAPPLIVAAIAVPTAIIGVAVAVAIAPYAWAVDITRNLEAARDLQAGRFGTDGGYLYSPLAALLTLTASGLPSGVAVAGWLGLKLAMIAWGVRHEARGLDPLPAALVAVAVVTFVPTIHDLLLGNVTVLLVAAVAAVAWRSDRWATGIPLGLVLATAPKPQLLPILVWMILFRPRSLAGACASAAGATAATVALVGPEPYLAWIDVLRAPDYLATSMAGNLAPQALLPGLAIPIWVISIAGLAIALRAGETAGFVAALAAGLLLAPYTMAYSAMMLLLAVRPMAERLPMTTAGLAAVGSIAVILALPLYALAWLLAAIGESVRGARVAARVAA